MLHLSSLGSTKVSANEHASLPSNIFFKVCDALLRHTHTIAAYTASIEDTAYRRVPSVVLEPTPSARYEKSATHHP